MVFPYSEFDYPSCCWWLIWPIQNDAKKTDSKMTEMLTNGYSYENSQRELTDEYQHDRVWMAFKKNCLFVLWTKLASALEGFKCPY